MSVVFHAALFIVLAFGVHLEPRSVSSGDVREVGIVLRSQNEASGDPSPSDSEISGDGAADLPTESGGPGDLLDVAPPSNPLDALPPLPDVLGPGGQTADKVRGATDLLRGGAGTRSVSAGKARTSVFGASAEGYKFVYVFDRSGSMGGSGHTALSAAKAELLKSLNDLDEIHQFEIVFYNEHPQVMDISGPGRLVFATEQNKALAREFISRIRADGATNHEDALLLALRLRPDVIFFLTDADEPTLNRRQLEHIRRVNAGIAIINAIEFGLGPSLNDDNFLKRLARENSGQHVYFDISQLRDRK